MLVAAVAVLVLWYFGTTWEAMAYFTFCCILLALSLIDLDHFLLPDVMTLSAIWIGLFINAFELLVPAREAILGAACGWVILAAINTVYKLISNRDGIGQGDWKLAAAIGAWLGLNGLLSTVLIAFLFGAIVGILLLVVSFRNRRTHVPFGPFLAVGGIIATFHGPDISNLYLEWLMHGG
jgi:leader peptidase (prepilin peptidase)/N-methyltransferase